MKKSAQLSKRSLLFFFTLVIAALIITVYTQMDSSKISSQRIQTSESYGPLGYGRGQGSGKGKLNTQAAKAVNKENCLMDGCLLAEDADYPVANLDEKTTESLNLALADERKALATYQATMAKFGSVKPFINIARAEEQHISMLLALFDKYGVSIPKDTTKVGPLPATLQEVCQVGVTAEIDNDALYQKMLPEIQHEDIKTVFTSLAIASIEMHLPAFKRCAN
ncbi:hypothetical protein KBD71_00360 [Candidatus Woesebacteria bacterium]|nr:hypothetical protein [Candidatus Woesebacteria bacterium]